LWDRVRKTVEDGKIGFNTEIMEELGSITGQLGECLQACAKSCCFEIGNDDWPWEEYIEHVEALKVTYEGVISEYNGNRKGTVGLNDISIIALAKTLNLPVISMEKANVYQQSETKMRIPDVCAAEDVPHIDFNTFLRMEGIKL